MWNLKYNANHHICEKNKKQKKQQTHRYREQTYVCKSEGVVGKGRVRSLELADVN